MSWVNKATLLFLVINIVIFLYIAYLLFWPAPLPIIYNEPFPLDKTEVARGEEISYLIHLNKRSDYTAELNRNIICEDGNLVTLAPSNSNVPQGEHKIWITLTIPNKTSLGVCHFELNNTYHINPLREIQVSFKSKDFFVVQ